MECTSDDNQEALMWLIYVYHGTYASNIDTADTEENARSIASGYINEVSEGKIYIKEVINESTTLNDKNAILILKHLEEHSSKCELSLLGQEIGVQRKRSEYFFLTCLPIQKSFMVIVEEWIKQQIRLLEVLISR